MCEERSVTEVLDDRQTEPSPKGRASRRWLWPLTAAVILVAAVVLVWFQPQKLFIDDRVDEAIPTATPGQTSEPADGGSPATSAAGSDQPVELSRGEFVSLDHGTSGVARTLKLADGQTILRLEGLSTDNGPDLFVYLSANPAGGAEGAFDDKFVNLGRLKGNIGDQNYDIPAGTDVAGLTTVVIWCDRFNSAFGAADLKGA